MKLLRDRNEHSNIIVSFLKKSVFIVIVLLSFLISNEGEGM